MSEMSEYISLKWGTLKAWKFNSDETRRLIGEYAALGMSMSAMSQQDTPEQKEIICQLIDAVDADTIHLDWDGVDISKEDAKKYVRDYGKKKDAAA
jgi:hypothetical protein